MVSRCASVFALFFSPLYFKTLRNLLFEVSATKPVAPVESVEWSDVLGRVKCLPLPCSLSLLRPTTMSVLRHLLRVSPEVSEALSLAAPNPLSSRLVLLESTILSHGMPYPDNLNMAKDVQYIIRERVSK